MAESYYVVKNAETIRLIKGMGKKEVIALLGKNYLKEPCAFPQNEKWVYRFASTKSMYKVLFTNNQLAWVFKTTYFSKPLPKQKRK